MKNYFENIRNIFWDFDGVILDSMPVRDFGFEVVLKEEGYNKDEISQLLVFHKKNGGLSRYVKFKYFYDVIRGERVDDNRIMELAKKFSKIMIDELCDVDLLIADSIKFIKTNHKKYDMYIVSGSDKDELQYICAQLAIDKYFKSILGSPIPKIDNIASIINKYGFKLSEAVLIGDSINDYEAANGNGISFIGYNNPGLRKYGDYIESLC